MGIHVMLEGSYGPKGIALLAPSPMEILNKINDWAHKFWEGILLGSHFYKTSQNQYSLKLFVHVAAEPIDIVVIKRGKIMLMAKTSNLGPGYHIFLCKQLRKMAADLKITWRAPSGEQHNSDNTGYFFNSQPAHVEEAMLNWLQNVMQNAKSAVEAGAENLLISMSTEHAYKLSSPIATPLGPRSMEWIEAVIEDPRAGLDIFPWRSEDIDAGFMLQRSLCEMWTEVHWRKPFDKEEEKILKRIASSLDAAYQTDPSLEYPWREWLEIAEYLGLADQVPHVRAKAISVLGNSRIGYRRQDVTANVRAGWSVIIPGEFAEEWENERTWMAGDYTRTLRFTPFAFPEGTDKSKMNEVAVKMNPADHSYPEQEKMKFSSQRIDSNAVIYPAKEEERSLWRLEAICTSDSGIALLSICFDDYKDRQWVIQTWHSVDHLEQANDV